MGSGPTRTTCRTAVLGLLFIALLPFSAATAEVPTPSPQPTISGTPVVGEKLTASAGVGYQWFAGVHMVAGADQQTFTPGPSEAGRPLTVKIAFADESTSPLVSEPTLLVATAATPSISGQTRVGSTVTATPNAWSKGTSFTYEWFAGATSIDTTTSRTLTIPSKAKDLPLTVKVAGTATGYPDVARVSKSTPRVMVTGAPTVTGAYAVGSTLTARPGTWSTGTKLTYRWFADGKAIAGATRSTHKIAAAQGRRKIRVDVTGAKSGYTSHVKSSSTSAKVFTAAATPKISGSRAVGRTLTLAKGSWMSGATTSYRWYAGGAPISGATKSSYKPTSGTAGKAITVSVVGRRAGYATVTKTSGKTAKIQRVGRATLGGSSTATRRLSARPGSWVSGTRFTYAWYLSGKRISGAQSSTIYVKPSWKGKRLSAKVTGRLSGYSTFTSTSNSSRAVVLPGRTSPSSSWNCPSWAPIKGNDSSMIYHKPGQSFYTRTKPEECFRTDAAALDAGYRKAKV